MPKANISVDRRINPRISIKVPVKYRLEKDKKVLKKIEEWRHNKEHAYTLDMSLSGMNIVVDQPLTKGEVMHFEVFLLDKKRVLTLYAEVKWANKKSAGLHFLLMKDEEKEGLRTFLENLSKT